MRVRRGSALLMLGQREPHEYGETVVTPDAGDYRSGKVVVAKQGVSVATKEASLRLEDSGRVLDVPQLTLVETSREERRRWRVCFGSGLLIQLLGLMVFAWLLAVPRLLPEREGPNLFRAERITLLLPPSSSLLPNRKVTLPPPPSPLKHTAKLPKAEPKPIVPSETLPVSTKAQPSLAPLPQSLPAVPRRAEAFEPAVPKGQLHMRVGTFGNGSVVATAKLPRSSIQTGGFGSPNGLPEHAEGGSKGNVPRLGAFDQPEGPGAGNGTGGEHGTRGLVASAGFGNGIAGAELRGGAPGTGNGSVRSGGFDDAQAQTHAPPLPKPQATVVPYEPVQITEKPDPVYTTEARQLRIQGEVLLRVVFTATGRVQLLSIERGLGHGLDEAATRAAEQIQFKPARRNGQPVDTTASVHILFQLAN